MKALYFLISLVLLVLLSAACAPTTAVQSAPPGVDPTVEACRVNLALCATLTPATGDMAKARGALEAFFDALQAGVYDKAAEIYGGSYEELIDMNPQADPDDHAALLKNACTVNGFQCLKMRKIVEEAQVWPDMFTFTVEFANPDGSLYVLRPCCGTTATEQAPLFRFKFTVMRIPQAGNAFRVQGLPVYVP